MKKLFLFSCSILFALSIHSQIVIDSVDFVQNVGQAWFTQTGDSITVNVGSSGGPNTWDFSSLSQVDDTSLYVLIEPSTAPHHTMFPTANLVELSTDYSDTSYQYSNLSFNNFTLLGYTFGDTAYKINNGANPLPINYLDTWQISTYDTIVDSGPFLMTISLTIDNSADAYGTVTISAGSYPCLRARGDILEIITIYYNTIPISTDTTNTISYSWFAENYPFIARMQSYDGDTNPNFTLADDVELYAGFTTGVEENIINTNSDIIFNSENCMLSYKNLRDEEIFIHDILGRNIWQENLNGTGSIALQIPNSGVYFLSSNYSNIKMKIVFIQ